MDVRYGRRGSRRRILLPAFLLAMLIIFPGPAAQAADTVTVGTITIEGLHSAGRAEMLDLLGVREGGQTDAAMVREGIKRAFLKGIFEYISVSTNDADPADMTVFVREKDRIRKVMVRGTPGLSAKRVRNLLILREGDIMRYDRIGAAERDLREQYSLSGYPEAVIRISTEERKDPYRVDLVATIEAGPPVLVEKVEIEGAGGITPDDLRLSPGDIYDQFRVKDDLKRLRERLRKDGYYHPVVGPYTFRDGVLRITADQGRRLEVTIEGNSAVSTRRLRKEVPFFDVEAVNDETVDEAVIRMRALYHTEGYPFAQIAPVVNEDKDAVRVTFFVFEGQRIKTRAIRFTGITLPPESLKNVMSLKEKEYFNPDLLERDRETLSEFYRALGYLEAAVSPMEYTIDDQEGRADITVAVGEGVRTLISSIDIQGISEEVRGRLQTSLTIKVGDPYNEVDVSDQRFRILDFFAQEGYPNVDVLVQRSISDHAASIVFTVAEGPKVRIGDMVVAGNQKTRYEVIRRELAPDKGKPYNLKTLAEERRKLYKLGLFDDVEIEPFSEGEGVKDLLVTVKEGNAGAFEFGVGYADYEQFRGYAEVSYRNLWGMNRQGLLRAELSSLSRRFITQYTEPWFLGRPIPFRVLFLYENTKEISVPDREVRYRIERYAASAGVEKPLTDRLKAEFYYEYSIVRTTDVQPDVVLSREDEGTLAISSLRPSLVYDSRDNPFDPSRGVVAGLSLKAASYLLFSQSDFVKGTLYASTFHRLSKRIILALSLRGGLAYGFKDTTELPIVERFFLGGRFSVRGYAQDTLGPRGADGNPTGGNAFAMGSVEFRTYVGRGVSIVPFLDFGNVWLDANDIDPLDIKFTTGLGLRYGTPVGPLRVDYGIKLNRGRDESRGELHFSIGHAF